ncbi:hypothetical protein BsWGS_03380 [Bradybaena similaris]
MAAPRIPASKRKDNLSTLSLKENTPKVTRKNILCPGSQEWPRVAKDVEDSILSKLTEKLTSSTNIIKHIKKSLADDHSEKARIRSQLEIGTSAVFRALERDRLTCVLISGQATPAITVDHIISLARSRGCPLLCLDQLAPTVARATKSKCLSLAIGFKVMDNSNSEFAEVISLVKSNTVVQLPQKQVNLSASQLVANRDCAQPGKTNKHRPVLVAVDAGKEILEILKKTFFQGVTGKMDTEKNTRKKKKKKKKKNLKDSFEKVYHQQFDIGKRTVTSFLERGKYEIILISEEIKPVLLAETQPLSLLSVAAVKRCPVVVLPGLVNAMRALCGGSVSVLGLKKLSSFQNEQKHFQQVIDACLQAIANVNAVQLSRAENQAFAEQSFSPTELEAVGEPHECCAGEEAPSVSMDIDKAEVQRRQATLDTSEKERLHDKNIEIISTNSSAEDVGEEDDYSYMYIMKTESKELAEVKKEIKDFTASVGNDHFDAEYISLSIGSNAPSSLRTQKGHFSVKQKQNPSPDVKSASLPSSKPKVLNSGRVSMETKLPGQQKDSFIPFTETRASNSQSFICDAEAKEVHKAGLQLYQKRLRLRHHCFTISRSGNAASQNKTAETAHRPQRNMAVN